MRHAYGDAHIHSDSDCDGNCHIHANGDCNGNAHTDSYANGHSDSNIYCNGYRDGYCHSDCDRTAAAYTHATASADTAGPSGHLLLREFRLHRDSQVNPGYLL